MPSVKLTKSLRDTFKSKSLSSMFPRNAVLIFPHNPPFFSYHLWELHGPLFTTCWQMRITFQPTFWTIYHKRKIIHLFSFFPLVSSLFRRWRMQFPFSLLLLTELRRLGTQRFMRCDKIQRRSRNSITHKLFKRNYGIDEDGQKNSPETKIFVNVWKVLNHKKSGKV